jgi:hypothetical protein
MKVEIQRIESSVAIVYEPPNQTVLNTYTKGELFCVMFLNSEGQRKTHKFPISQIFKICEDYNDSKR